MAAFHVNWVLMVMDGTDGVFWEVLGIWSVPEQLHWIHAQRLPSEKERPTDTPATRGLRLKVFGAPSRLACQHKSVFHVRGTNSSTFEPGAEATKAGRSICARGKKAKPCCRCAPPPPSGTSACYQTITQRVTIVARLSDKSKAYVMTALHSLDSIPQYSMRSNKSYADHSWVDYCAVVFMMCTSKNDSAYGFAWPYVVHRARTYGMNRRTPADARPTLIHSRGANICLQLDSLNWPQPSRECQMERRGEGAGCFVWKLSAWDTMLPPTLHSSGEPKSW